ncbi:hypothetical protein DSM106972_026930 [Dulcicalothrix desertica PCC 7102]|uniref:AB hydrolase-1 domain-containing protein n=1 Tax=Dulcicalothrix desertica PCC 7102 TaxID=232991 RepID=A0A3S1APZ7_9CYAN|nr:alpha/beta hydrolase [Dulcicalothrix desertica]RUT06436.1 hypothetical protein DSM106972_026930 [Dulcicalothrix desertica PCC 7102]TWH50420.1 putative serine esterase DUF676 [Dulcicalothrix desertica PCC 7102]
MTTDKWVRKAKNGLNIVFIHGINSSDDCWRNSNGSYWPQLLADESELADIGIYLFSYRTGLNTGFYSLSYVVDSLREYFVLDDLFDGSGVIFVCHSMGGIVTRRFLVNQHSALIEKGLNKIGLFLVASPSLGSEYANMLSILSRIMGHTQASGLKFSQDNVWLNDLDKDFINLKTDESLQIKGKELIEDLPLYGKRLIKRQIVEPFSGAKYFGNSFKVPGSDHSTIATPADENAVQHRLLVQFIKEFVETELGSAKLDDSLVSIRLTIDKIDNINPVDGLTKTDYTEAEMLDRTNVCNCGQYLLITLQNLTNKSVDVLRVQARLKQISKNLPLTLPNNDLQLPLPEKRLPIETIHQPLQWLEADREGSTKEIGAGRIRLGSMGSTDGSDVHQIGVVVEAKEAGFWFYTIEALVDDLDSGEKLVFASNVNSISVLN